MNLMDVVILRGLAFFARGAELLLPPFSAKSRKPRRRIGDTVAAPLHVCYGGRSMLEDRPLTYTALSFIFSIYPVARASQRSFSLCPA